MNFQVVLVSEETLALCMQWYHLPPVSAFYHLQIQLTPNLKNELCWLLKYQLNDVKFYPEKLEQNTFLARYAAKSFVIEQWPAADDAIERLKKFPKFAYSYSFS